VDELMGELKSILNQNKQIVEYKIVAYIEDIVVDKEQMDELSLSNMDYLAKFTEFIVQTIGDSPVIREELTHISGGNK
jgi:hypothetical protein